MKSAAPLGHVESTLSYEAPGKGRPKDWLKASRRALPGTAGQALHASGAKRQARLAPKPAKPRNAAQKRPPDTDPHIDIRLDDSRHRRTHTGQIRRGGCRRGCRGAADPVGKSRRRWREPSLVLVRPISLRTDKCSAWFTPSERSPGWTLRPSKLRREPMMATCAAPRLRLPPASMASMFRAWWRARFGTFNHLRWLPRLCGST